MSSAQFAEKVVGKGLCAKGLTAKWDSCWKLRLTTIVWSRDDFLAAPLDVVSISFNSSAHNFHKKG